MRPYNQLHICTERKKLLTGVEQDWKILAKAAYKNVGFPAVFASTVKSIRGIESVQNKFWEKVLETWTMLYNNNDTEVKLTQPIFKNKLLIYQGTPLFNKQCILGNILWVKDLFINDIFTTREEFNNTVGAGARNFMNYNLLRTVVLNKVNRNGSLDNYDQKPLILFQDNTFENFKRQDFLKHWARKFQMFVPKDMWSIPWRSTKETRLRALQFKILHNIYPTNIILEEMGIAPNSLCQLGKVQDFTEHFCAECTAVKPMWKEIEKYLAIYPARSIKLSPSSILLGIDNSIASVNEQKIINHAILIGKMCISKFKYGKPTDLISLFQTECKTRQLKMFSPQ